METITPIFYLDLTLKLPHGSLPIQFLGQSKRMAIVGPSGSGKSSLAKALTGIRQEQGSFRFQGQEILHKHPWERKIGYLPQDLLLLPHLSVKQNLLFSAQARLVQDVLDSLKISHLLDRMPRNLSGGEKQRVALARALFSQADFLILDEPFSSLDKETKKQIIQYVNTITTPFILISHEQDEITQLGCETFELPTLQ